MVVSLSDEPVVASLSLIATLAVSLALAITIIGYVAWPGRGRSRVRELQKAKPATDVALATDTRRQLRALAKSEQTRSPNLNSPGESGKDYSNVPGAGRPGLITSSAAGRS